MKIDENKLLQTVNSKWRVAQCPMCGNNGLGLDPTIYELREFNNGDIIMGGDQTLVPLIRVSCSKCGYTMLGNPKQMGLM